MKTQVQFKTKTTLTLLITIIAMNGAALFLFTRIDNLVHGDLYKYGLKFSQEWAANYWLNARLLIYSITVSIISMAAAAPSVLIYARRRTAASRVACCLLLTIGTALTIFSFYLLTRVDYIIHHELYHYGLTFSLEWATNYWTLSGLTLGLTGLSGAITLIPTSLIMLSARKKGKIHPARIFSPILVAAGAAALILSIMYASSTLAFVGLGLTFWGAILAYIKSEEHVKASLLNATALTPLATLNQIMQELRCEGKAVYLPPKYLTNPEESKAYIARQKEGKLPMPEQIQEHQAKIFIENPKGILLTPPGAELTKLFEKTLETTFTRTNLHQVQQALPKLFVEDLEIAQSTEINVENNKVHVKIENSNYQKLTKETEKLSHVYNSLGCPLASAIACTLAKATGKPITIRKQQTHPQNNTIEIEYLLIEEEE